VFVVCPATLGSGHNVNETWRLGLEILETKKMVDLGIVVEISNLKGA
jgi:hypothetical protein